jgi:hypothetical protein
MTDPQRARKRPDGGESAQKQTKRKKASPIQDLADTSEQQDTSNEPLASKATGTNDFATIQVAIPTVNSMLGTGIKTISGLMAAVHPVSASQLVEIKGELDELGLVVSMQENAQGGPTEARMIGGVLCLHREGGNYSGGSIGVG